MSSSEDDEVIIHKKESKKRSSKTKEPSSSESGADTPNNSDEVSSGEEDVPKSGPSAKKAKTEKIFDSSGDVCRYHILPYIPYFNRSCCLSVERIDTSVLLATELIF